MSTPLRRCRGGAGQGRARADARQASSTLVQDVPRPLGHVVRLVTRPSRIEKAGTHQLDPYACPERHSGGTHSCRHERDGTGQRPWAFPWTDGCNTVPSFSFLDRGKAENMGTAKRTDLGKLTLGHTACV
jgi:hypothetical protein